MAAAVVLGDLLTMSREAVMPGIPNLQAGRTPDVQLPSAMSKNEALVGAKKKEPLKDSRSLGLPSKHV